MGLQQFLGDPVHLRVARGQQADRPVRPDQESFRSERVDDDGDVCGALGDEAGDDFFGGCARRRRGVLPVRLGDESGELAGDVGQRGQAAEIPLPGRVDGRVAKRGLGDVIEHERNVRPLGDGL